MKTFLEIARTTGFLAESSGQNKSGDFMLSESGGKLSKVEYDLIDANKGRASGSNAVGADGKEHKNITILTATDMALRFIRKDGADLVITEYSKIRNTSNSMDIYAKELKYIK